MTKPIPPTIKTPSMLILMRSEVSSQLGFSATWNKRLTDCRKLCTLNSGVL